MEQMIALWSVVMVHGLMVAGLVIRSFKPDSGVETAEAPKIWGLVNQMYSHSGRLSGPSCTEAPETQIYFQLTGLGPFRCSSTGRRPRRTVSVDRE